MADPSRSHNKSHRALSLILNLSSVSLSSRPKLSLNPCSLFSKTLSNELNGRPSQAHSLTVMGFTFLHSCSLGFIFLWFLLWVHLIFVVLVVGLSNFLRSRIRLALSLHLGDLE